MSLVIQSKWRKELLEGRNGINIAVLSATEIHADLKPQTKARRNYITTEMLAEMQWNAAKGLRKLSPDALFSLLMESSRSNLITWSHPWNTAHLCHQAGRMLLPGLEIQHLAHVLSMWWLSVPAAHVFSHRASCGFSASDLGKNVATIEGEGKLLPFCYHYFLLAKEQAAQTYGALQSASNIYPVLGLWDFLRVDGTQKFHQNITSKDCWGLRLGSPERSETLWQNYLFSQQKEEKKQLLNHLLRSISLPK